MKANHAFILLIFLLSVSTLTAQILQFNDTELKRYLITEQCVDTTNSFWGTGHIDADLNNDGEIDSTEANSVVQLLVEDFGDLYEIYSIADLNYFKNLNWLKLVSLNTIVKISDLHIDSLRSLWIGANPALKIVDVSGLINLTQSLRIEGIDTLDFINLKNGSVPQVFSLFYSEHIHYACIDSIAKEYDEVLWRMISEPPAIENCNTTPNGIETGSIEFNIYPNPANDHFIIESNERVKSVKFYNSNGGFIGVFQSTDHIDLSNFSKGMYLVEIRFEKTSFFKKVVKY